MNQLNRVVIFGATSSIAEHTARILVQRGSSIHCVAKDAEKLDRVINDLRVRAGSDQVISAAVADLQDVSLHEELIQNASQALDGLDAALIAYGNLPDQKTCEQEFEQARRALELNGISVISLLSRLANRFESEGRGTIAAISSVAGDRGRQSNYIYGTAKGMVSIFMQGVRNRLSAKGIDVITIKPGFVDTPMTEGFDKKGLLWASPDTVAQGIVSAMLKGKSEVYLPWFWRPIMMIIRHIPERVFKRLSL